MSQFRKLPYIYLYICLLTRFKFFILCARTNNYSIDYTYLLERVVIATNSLKKHESTLRLAQAKTNLPPPIKWDIQEEEIYLTSVNIKRTESTAKVNYKYNSCDCSHLFRSKSPYLIEKVFNGPQLIWDSADYDDGFGTHVVVRVDHRGKRKFRIYFQQKRPKSQLVLSSDEYYVSDPPKISRRQEIPFDDSGDDYVLKSAQPKHSRKRDIPFDDSEHEYVSDAPKGSGKRNIPFEDSGDEYYVSGKPKGSRTRDIAFEDSEVESVYKSDEDRPSRRQEIPLEDSEGDYSYKSEDDSSRRKEIPFEESGEEYYVSGKSKGSKGRNIPFEDSGDDYVLKSAQPKHTRKRDIPFEESSDGYVSDAPKGSGKREIRFESEDENLNKSDYESGHKAVYQPESEGEPFDQHEFTLDVNNTDNTIFVHYIRQEPFTDIFIPKSGYAISKILKDEKIVWLHNHGDYPAKVVVEPDSAGVFRVTPLFPKDLKGKRFVKSPKINHLHGLQIYTKGSSKVTDPCTYELSAVKNVSVFKFKQGVKCHEVRYLGEKVWKHGDFGYQQYPNSISYFRGKIIDVYLGGPFLTYERSSKGVWKGSQCDLRMFIRDPNDQTQTKEIESSQYELKEKYGDITINFFKGVECVEVRYKDTLVWEHFLGHHPISIEYVPNEMIYIFFPNEFLLFINSGGDWVKHKSYDVYKYVERSYQRGGKNCLFEWIKDVTEY